MNDKSRPSKKEEIFDVFRPGGDHDVSAENYRLKKQAQPQTTGGPTENNHFTSTTASAPTGRIEPHTLTLSGTETLGTSGDQIHDATPSPDTTDPQTTIRLETFRLGMEERLAAMQIAQQKAKDQLSDLEGQSQGQAKLPES